MKFLQGVFQASELIGTRTAAELRGPRAVNYGVTIVLSEGCSVGRVKEGDLVRADVIEALSVPMMFEA
jgi:hypothetical protein